MMKKIQSFKSGFGFSGGAMMAKRPACKSGFGFSIEAMLAAFVLFAILLFSANFNTISSEPYKITDPLKSSAEDLASIGVKSGAWAETVGPYSRDDSRARALLDSLPPGLCAKAEIFHDTMDISNLSYSYAPANCTGRMDDSRAQAFRPFVVRTNSTLQSFYIAKVASWPRSG